MKAHGVSREACRSAPWLVGARSISAVTVAGALVACGNAGPGAGEEAQFHEWRIETEIRIDGHEHELVPVNWVAVSSDGDVAIAQTQDRTVRIFDDAGQPVVTVGGAGGGPGEFGSPALTGGWTGDALWVFDLLQSRITQFSAAGELLGTAPVARPASFSVEAAEVSFSNVTPHGVHVDGTLTASIQSPTGPGAESWLNRIATGLVSPDGTITSLFGAHDVMQTFLAQCGGGRMSMVRFPFENEPQFESARDGSRSAVLTADLTGPDAGTFRLVVYDPAGDTLFARRHPFESVPITPAAADSIIQARVQNLDACDPAAAARYREEAEVPAVRPPFSASQALLIANDGSIWLRLWEDGPDAEHIYLILDPAGEPAGRLTLPPNTLVRAADATHVWTVELDAFDVPSVVRSRLVR